MSDYEKKARELLAQAEKVCVHCRRCDGTEFHVCPTAKSSILVFVCTHCGEPIISSARINAKGECEVCYYDPKEAKEIV